MTKFANILKGSLKNIVNNKLRSFLTMLGLVIGIASVIILVGIRKWNIKSGKFRGAITSERIF